MTTPTNQRADRLADPTFWHQPLDDRMVEFAEIRELGAILPVTVENPLAGITETVHAVTRYDEVVHISKHPDDFCSIKFTSAVLV